MKDTRKTEIRVGVLTILGIILFLLIFGWAKDIQLFGEDQLVKIEFNSVAGLEEGDRVTVFGIRKGHVEDISLVNNKVIVTAMLDHDTKLYDDSKFSIMMMDMMGSKKIEIDPGNSGNLLDLQKVHSGKFVGDLASAMEAFSDVQDDLTSVVAETKNTISNINKILNDEKVQSDIKNSLSNLNSLTRKLNTIVKQNEDGLKTLIENGNKLAESANSLVTENRGNIDSILTEMKNVVSNSNNLISKLDVLTSEVQNKENNIGKLLYDDELIKDLKATISQVKEMTAILIEQLKNEGVNVDAHIF
jgi:phospholipid/cholesterol/gamma-HCH transport system substrate-binding protein